MREILFKAKRTKTGEWIEGFYLSDNDLLPGAYICPKLTTTCREKGEMLMGGFIPVVPATVCQYTGLTDKNGVKIFEGDYLCDWCEDENGGENFCAMGVVTYWEDEGKFVLADENGLCNDWTLEDEAQPENWKHLTVLGNAREEAPHEH